MVDVSRAIVLVAQERLGLIGAAPLDVQNLFELLGEARFHTGSSMSFGVVVAPFLSCNLRWR